MVDPLSFGFCFELQLLIMIILTSDICLPPSLYDPLSPPICVGQLLPAVLLSV